MTKGYPITVDVKVGVTDGGNRGEATYSMPSQRLPTDEDMQKALRQVEEAIPDGYRIMTYEEHFAHIVQDKFGPSVPLAAPKPPAPWHKEEGHTWHDLWELNFDEEED